MAAKNTKRSPKDSKQVGYSVPAVATGKPVVRGGSLGRKEATGRGLVSMIQDAAAHIGLDLRQATAVVQGFGNVGSNAARFLAESGVKLIGVSDQTTGICNLGRGANGPTTLEADDVLNAHGIFVLPDVLGNAGGVTVSYFEWVQDTQNYTWSLDQINERLHEIMTGAFRRTLDRSRRDKVDMRTAALMEGIQRVAEAKLLHGLFP